MMTRVRAGPTDRVRASPVVRLAWSQFECLAEYPFLRDLVQEVERAM